MTQDRDDVETLKLHYSLEEASEQWNIPLNELRTAAKEGRIRAVDPQSHEPLFSGSSIVRWWRNRTRD
ncbi:MAG: hypothetical protein R3E66_17885 [bacterium]